ncbi:MAG: O-antigen ligase family protein [Archangium sp.]|nr:O-antigen ligase family protein [Archangium sp.]
MTERWVGERANTVRFWALVFWAVGIQTHELASTAAFALLVLSFFPTLFLKLQAGKLETELKPWRPLLAFIAWSLLAPTIAGQYPDWTGFARTMDWASIPLIAAAASALTPRRWAILTLAAVGTLGLSSLVAGLQHFGIWPPLSTFADLDWLRIPFARVYEQIGDSGRFMGGGLLFHRLKFGHVSGLIIVGAVVASKHLTGAARTAVIALGTFGFIAVWVFPYARAGAVSMTIAVGLTVALVSTSPARALAIAAGLGLIGIIAVLSIAPLRARFASALTDQGSGQRTQHMAAGVEAVRQHPFVGIGPGQFRPSKFSDPNMAEHVKDNPGKAHNQYLSMAAETGIPGALGFIALLIWLALSARGRPYGAMTQGSIVFFALLSLAHDPLFQAPVSMAMMLAIGLGLCLPLPAQAGRGPG